MLSAGETVPDGRRGGNDGTLDCALWVWGRASGGRIEVFRVSVPLGALRAPAMMRLYKSVRAQNRKTKNLGKCKPSKQLEKEVNKPSDKIRCE